MNGNNEESTRTKKKITPAEENEKLFLIFHKPCGKEKMKKNISFVAHMQEIL